MPVYSYSINSSLCLYMSPLLRRQQRLNRSLEDLLRISNNNSRYELKKKLHALFSISVSRLKQILDDADRKRLI